jgi:putative transposase
VYLAVVLDLYSRFIVGWHVSNRLTADLVTSAIRRALEARRPGSDLVLHTDRGAQYTSHETFDLAEDYDFQLSMGAQGSCYDNAVTESFFHTLKTEHIGFEDYDTREEARLSIFDYIELFYNRKRIHTTIGNLSPWLFEQLNEPT